MSDTGMEFIIWELIAFPICLEFGKLQAEPSYKL